MLEMPFDKVRAEPLPLPPQDEKLLRLHDLWNVQRGASALPDRSEVKPESFRFMLGLINLVDATEGPPYRFRLVGTEIAYRHNRELTNQTTEILKPHAYRETIEGHFTECRRRRAPTLYQLNLSDGERTRSYRRLMLPYADSSGAIVLIVTGAHHLDRLQDVVQSKDFLED